MSGEGVATVVCLLVVVVIVVAYFRTPQIDPRDRGLPASELHRLEVEAGIRKPEPRTYVTRENARFWRDEHGQPRDLTEWDPYDFDQREAEASARRRQLGPDRIDPR